MSDLENNIIKALKEAKEFAQGKNQKARIHFMPDVREIRKKFDMSQATFAETFHLSEGSIKNWEQGRRVPDEATKVLLAVIAKHPEAVIDALD
ncbi:MAG: helix-turn-helix domain-containing protein [Rickettsiales bacterium]|jgi:putative transcriptional regulator|nr:helix-turn-helix domain-containing protein [Rickettsiales bacterium]